MSINPLNDITRVYLEQVAVQDGDLDEEMTMKDFKQQRSRQKQKEKRAADKIAPGRRAGIHADKASPERAARHRANVDPDFEGNDERNYPGGKLRPNKVRKAKALGELGESSHLETDMKKRAEANEKARKEIMKTKAHADMVKAARKHFNEAKKGDGNLANNYPPYDKVTRGDVIAGAIGKDEMGGKKKKKVEEGNDGNLANNYPPYDKVTRGDVIAGRLGKDQMGGKKKVTKEGFSNWRQDLSEIVSQIEGDKKIAEKKVQNKITINPKLGESVEELGGTLLEMVEIDEFDFIVESAYDELLDEGYDEDDIEEALEYALTEAKVTFGHDTPSKKKRSGILDAARKKLSGVKKAAKQAVATGARKVAKGALSVARKIEGGDKTPTTARTGVRKASTYRGAGAGTKERVSSGSYTPPTKKKAEKPADPWEGSATTPAKPKTKKAAAPKAKAPAATKRKRKSKLDDLLASVRSENVQIDEKTLTAAEKKKREEIAQKMNLQDFEKRYPGRGMEVKMATATKLAKKIAEQAMELQPKTQQPNSVAKQIQQRDLQSKKRLLQQKMAALNRGSTDIDV